jgi:hypothetical protein
MKLLKTSILLSLIFLTSCSLFFFKDDPKLRLKYKNTKYLFTLEFPEKWLSYMDFEQNEIIGPQLDIPVIYFALPTRSGEWQSLNLPQGYAELFFVRIFTPYQWKLYQEKYKDTDTFKLTNLTFEGRKFIYMIEYSSSLPVDLYLYMKDSSSIIKTFRMLVRE